ncbi:hypothetical protein [Halobaculum sp. MBLA0143]|uniref:hypothetical protein n=1 Tax=Halobaculum sp. MBLA0143 TaxID=3079933 RepID=UPI0035255924
MSSVVVMTEGRHDVEFLRVLHRRVTDRRDYDTFLADETDDTQEKRIRQHRVDDATRWLYKAEGGRSRVLKKFRSNALRLAAVELVLLVDLDGEAYGTFEEQFNDTLDEHYDGKLRVTSRGRRATDHLQAHDCGVIVGGTEEYRFDLLAFHDDLETVTGVERGEDRSTYREKLAQYVADNEVVRETVRETVL